MASPHSCFLLTGYLSGDRCVEGYPTRLGCHLEALPRTEGLLVSVVEESLQPLQTISLLSLSIRGQPCGHTVRLLKASPLMIVFRECSPISEISLGDRSRDHSIYSPARRCMVCDTNENDINSSLVILVLVLLSKHPVIAPRKLLTDNLLASRSTEHLEGAC